jgi:malonyl-CoA O-methyltransferase
VKLSPARILDAGSGPAPQAGALKQRYRGAQVVALDISPEMLRRIESPGLFGRLAGKTRTAAVCADIVRMPLASRAFSLVWSNMALHWAASPQAALGEFHRVLEVEGLLMFSTPGPDTLKELRSAFSAPGAAPHVHSFIDMHDLGDMLVAAGFSAPVMDTETVTLTYSGVEAMTDDLRASGQACALELRARGLLGRARWQAVRGALEATKREGRLAATVEVVYGHAWKGAPRRTPEGHAVVNFGSEPRLRN